MIAVRLDGKNQRPVGWPDSHSGVWRLIAAAHGLVSSFGWLLLESPSFIFQSINQPWIWEASQRLAAPERETTTTWKGLDVNMSLRKRIQENL